MAQPIFITGIGTGIGKTLVSAIVTEALEADYWKPVQAGFSEGTDSEWVLQHLSNGKSLIHPEIYKLRMAASPHIAARHENVNIRLSAITAAATAKTESLHQRNADLVIEGAGGLMVPLNDTEFVADLIKQLNARVILVSRNYLGSINHSLLTAAVCRDYKLDVLGWIFNDQYLSYEEEIVHWSGYPSLASIPFAEQPSREFVKNQAAVMSRNLKKMV